MLRPGRAVAQAFRRSFDWRGRSRRSEFWWFQLFGALLTFGAGEVDIRLGWPVLALEYTPITLAVLLLTLPAYATVAIRRMHDIGVVGVWTLVSAASIFVPLAAWETTARFVMRITGWRSFSILGPGLSEAEIAVSVALILMTLLILAMMILALLPGTRGPNRYGPDPKRPELSMDTVFD